MHSVYKLQSQMAFLLMRTFASLMLALRLVVLLQFEFRKAPRAVADVRAGQVPLRMAVWTRLANGSDVGYYTI